jgi:hypothetical protein
MSANKAIENPFKEKNIFNKIDYELIVKRINQLSNSSKRLWGTMELPQMLEHCSIQQRLALGLITDCKTEGSFFYRTPLVRWVALYGPNWQKNLGTPSPMKQVKQSIDNSSFQTEKNELLNHLQLVTKKNELLPHPFFGKLNKKDWGRLIWKHLDHHLRQFGV